MEIYIIILCIILYLLFVTEKPKNIEKFNYVDNFRKAREDRDNYEREKNACILERDRCNTNLIIRTGERDRCNTNLSSRTGERDICNTNLSSSTNERDICHSALATSTSERDTCNTNYEYNSNYLNELISLQNKYFRIFTPFNRGLRSQSSQESIHQNGMNIDGTPGQHSIQIIRNENNLNMDNMTAMGNENNLNMDNMTAMGTGVIGQ
jgi:hypothetical protein